MIKNSLLKAEVITIGDEILQGFVQDTNASYLGQRLTNLGVEVLYKTSVGDDSDLIEKAIGVAWRRANLVITTGGLGPTADDRTKKVVAKVFRRPLVLKNSVLHKIREHFKERAIKMPPLNISQALFPQGARILENPLGTAPGIFIQEDDKLFFSLPGVPVEMKSIFETNIEPILKQKQKGGVLIQKLLKTTGITESVIAERIQGILKEFESIISVAYLPEDTGVNFRLVIKGCLPEEGGKKLQEIEEKIRKEIGDYIYGSDEETLEEIIGYSLLMKKKTIAVAESCTGGLIGNRITNVSGSSVYFLGDVVAYSNELKKRLLQVSEKILDVHGAVSSETVRAMAKGVRKLCGSDLGLAVTGIAGPTGGTKEKPVGLVYIGLDSEEGTLWEERRFSGNRRMIKEKIAQAALDLVRRHLLK